MSKVSHTGFDSCRRRVAPIPAGPTPEKQMGVVTSAFYGFESNNQYVLLMLQCY